MSSIKSVLTVIKHSWLASCLRMFSVFFCLDKSQLCLHTPLHASAGTCPLHDNDSSLRFFRGISGEQSKCIRFRVLLTQYDGEADDIASVSILPADSFFAEGTLCLSDESSELSSDDVSRAFAT